MKSMHWHCGFCDKFYKGIPFWGSPKWMTPEEVQEWELGWKAARRLL